MDTKHILKEYIQIYDKYKSKYGENTVVLMEVGSFFEIYAVINDEVNIGPDIYHICQNILQISVTKRNKKIQEVSYNNYLQAGFPNVVIQKFENILLNNNYTVVIVEHITKPPNPERGVTRVVSPGTSLDNYNKEDNHFLMSIYIEKNEYLNKEVYTAGISTIDLSTGRNYLHSIISKLEDSNYWNDEIGRYIHFYNPSEIIFHFKNTIMNQEKIIQNWDIFHNSIQINHYTDNSYYKLSYQNEFLQKIFKLENMLSPIEYFDLEKSQELILSYIFLLQYVFDHRADTLENIENPEIIIDDKHLCLTSNSIRQLNVINNYSYFKGKNESLLSVCNLCVTPMGRRLFKDRLLYPSINEDIINTRYNFIEMFMIDNYYENVHNELKKISDLEKSLRKMGLNLLQPYEFFSDSISFDYIKKVMKILQERNDIIEYYDGITQIIGDFNDFYEEIKHTFNFNNFSPHGNLDRSIFNNGIFSDLDEYDKLTEEYHTILISIAKRLSNFLDNSDSSVKIDYDDRNCWHIYCTNKRASTIKERLANINDNNIHVKDCNDNIFYSMNKSQFSFKKKDKSSTILELDHVNDISKKLLSTQQKLIKMNKENWNTINGELYRKYNIPLKKLYTVLANIDFYCSGSKLAIQNSYSRPEIVSSDKSFIDVKGIRHPIVEKIHTETEYITNDIIIGKQDSKDGILLFGTNACGKSTFMKSIGLNIILAQSGLFVAAKEFKYKPYTQIFTRILNNDNIFKSQSSFAVEIQELKSILNRSNSSSLVLGDELCSGTESISALSIIATGLTILCERKSSFIFTSHLHQLTNLEEINDLKNLEIYHLKIKYDKETDVLIYDRKLEKGSGPSIYGLKVCEAMGLNNDFISFAKKIQNRLENEKIQNDKLSQYNSNVFMDECKICFSKTDQLETHHIKDQKYADKNNIIDHHHKNIQHNLVPLCKSCHLKVTNKDLEVSGWIETSEGKKLEWKTITKDKKKNKKFNDEQINIILSVNDNNTSLTKKDIMNKIELDHNLKVSPSTFKKIIDRIY